MKERIQNYFKGNYKSFYEKYLRSIKQIGGHEYQSLCCLHQDTKPSFNFNNKTGQYFCHGCNKKGDIFHFYGKINSLNTRHDFRKILKGIANDFGISWEEKKSKIVKTYDYQDASGKLLFQVVRMDPKSFKQRQPVGSGWTWTLKGINPVIYNLPNVRKANEVLIVEGEKDCDFLTSLGFIATTSPMGAKKWRDEYNQYLQGKGIVLIPDNDNEGREHMTKVALSLNGTAKSLKWIDLPGLPSKGDVSDWVAKFEPKEEAAERLAVMIDRADFYEPPKKKSFEDVIVSTSELIKMDIPEKQTLLNPWLKEDQIDLGTGGRGIGKSWLGLSVVNAVSKGEAFGPWECKKSVPCLFLDGEMSASDIIERITALDLHSERPNPLYIYSDALANQYGLPRAHLANESWRLKMKSILLARKIKFWVIDNLASLASGID
ncbi:MAG: AAA family ATPase [Desulfobacteraceae bacterium]|nr:MAG: AAA family ATPase [Desulfobacteraceae bacterium]